MVRGKQNMYDRSLCQILTEGSYTAMRFWFSVSAWVAAVLGGGMGDRSPGCEIRQDWVKIGDKLPRYLG